MRKILLALTILFVSCSVSKEDSYSCHKAFLDADTYRKISNGLIDAMDSVPPNKREELLETAHRFSKMSDSSIRRYVECTVKIKKKEKSKYYKQIDASAKTVDSLTKEIKIMLRRELVNEL